MAKTGSRLIAALLLLVAALALKGELTSAPPPAAPGPGGFDTARALQRLGRVLGDQRPHPVDTAADDAVRGRLVAELQAIGLTPRVTEAWACNGGAKSRSIGCASVRNVVASLGPANGSHLLLVSHYDSTPTGPGAADDGIGVTSMLEIAALLKAHPPRRPVDFLFDEGEEAGLLGARAFLEHDPLAPHVDSLINMESRGVTGPAIMFETSRPNGGAIDVYRRAASRPVANSMTTDFYRLIPNATDVTVFAARPWTILNFAIIGNETRYHSAGDRLDALDPRSLRHMGTEALAATEKLASGPPAADGGEYVYADVLGRALVVLPKTLALGSFAALIAAFASFGWRRRAGLGRAAGAVTAGIAGSALLAFAVQEAIGLFRPGLYWRAHPGIIAIAVDMAAFAACAAALAWIGRPSARDRLRAAFWLVFLLLGLLIALAAPGAVIFALLPPLPLLIGAGLERRLPGAETAGAVLSWVLLFLFWAPLLHLSEVLLDFPLGPVFAAISALLVLPVLVELKALTASFPRWRVPAALGVAALASWTAVALAPAYSADRKQNFRIEYGWDQQARKGEWLISEDGASLPTGFPGAAGFRSGVEVPWSSAKRRGAPAPALPLAPPQVVKIAESGTTDGGRLIRLRFASAGADQILLRAEPDSGLVGASVAGSDARFGAGKKTDPFFIRCAGRTCDGAVMDLRVGRPGPLTLTVIGIRFGLPGAAAPLVAARPATSAPQYSPDSSFAVDRIRL
ncbi:MAG TPA: M20/M25/M40 family metallo-hydrolase [Allosphingosinicella sp.]|nr:M20/M25/M40 family metallo-hydrolase [Allosphingosinicella sp.]